MTGNLSVNSADVEVLKESKTISHSSTGSAEFLGLLGDDIANNAFTVDVPSDAPITDLQLTIEPSAMQTHYGFTWEGELAWDVPDSTMNGTVVEIGSLTGSTAGTLWDFNSGLQGWTVSNPTFVGHWTNSCGFNGTTGGSIKTQANYNAPHYATSPVVNLAGAPSMPLTAWVLQGGTGCGEEPDSTEDLQIQYKDVNGNWVVVNTWPGAPYGPHSPQQWSTNLPAAALHATSQIRINQISGSGSGATCCDFWFVDDVNLASPPESHWVSPTIGWGIGATQPVSRSTYAPLHLDLDIPSGAFLNWTILDDAGNEIMGAHGSNDVTIPLNMVDYEMYPLVRVKLEFRGSPTGTGIPYVHSISGDGQMMTSFRGGVADLDWDQGCMRGGSVTFSKGVVASIDCNLTSPWMIPSSPTKVISGSSDIIDGQLQIRYDMFGNWTNVSSTTFTESLGDTIYRYQFRIIHDGSNSSQWSSKMLSWTLLGGKHPAQPAIDFNEDGFTEWGGSDNRVGSWGWQDRFENGEDRISVNPGISGTASTLSLIHI